MNVCETLEGLRWFGGGAPSYLFQRRQQSNSNSFHLAAFAIKNSKLPLHLWNTTGTLRPSQINAPCLSRSSRSCYRFLTRSSSRSSITPIPSPRQKLPITLETSSVILLKRSSLYPPSTLVDKLQHPEALHTQMPLHHLNPSRKMSMPYPRQNGSQRRRSRISTHLRQGR